MVELDSGRVEIRRVDELRLKRHSSDTIKREK